MHVREILRVHLHLVFILFWQERVFGRLWRALETASIETSWIIPLRGHRLLLPFLQPILHITPFGLWFYSRLFFKNHNASFLLSGSAVLCVFIRTASLSLTFAKCSHSFSSAAWVGDQGLLREHGPGGSLRQWDEQLSCRSLEQVPLGCVPGGRMGLSGFPHGCSRTPRVQPRPARVTSAATVTPAHGNVGTQPSSVTSANTLHPRGLSDAVPAEVRGSRALRF